MFETLIEPSALKNHLEDPDRLIIDCRYVLSDPEAGYRAYLDAHIPGAIYASLRDDLSGPPVTDRGRHPLPRPERLREVFSDLGIDAGMQVVAYDDAAGSIAARLWWLLQYMNHRKVSLLDGGWPAWREAGFEVDSGDGNRVRRVFAGSALADRVINVDQVPQASLLLDSRDPQRFSGEQEPLDPVAGHIPGARSYHWMRNVDERGRFLPASRIRGQLQALYGETAPDRVTFYCGSGVTACQNIFSAVHAGLPFPRLYAGSWSEWCADPRRPVAIGRDTDA